MSCSSLAKIRQITQLQQQKYISKPYSRPTTKKTLMVKENSSDLPQRPANSALDDRKIALFSCEVR